MKRFTIPPLLILTALPSVSLVGQEFTGAASFFVGLPQGQFKDNVDNPGLGLTANIGYAPRKYPFMVGLEFGFMNYGTERRREPFSTTISDVTVEVETANNFALGHLLARLQPNSGSIRQYVEGAVGFHHFLQTRQSKTRGVNARKLPARPTLTTLRSASVAVS
ncbi:MAG: hypothetical protein HYZ01_09350 [Ignavibacteriales bacterium]|nr:hypothetical protein [Ignavibacteriales bacterium]